MGTYIPNLRKIGQKLRSIQRTIGVLDRQTYFQVILYLSNVMHCIGQTKIQLQWQLLLQTVINYNWITITITVVTDPCLVLSSEQPSVMPCLFRFMCCILSTLCDIIIWHHRRFILDNRGPYRESVPVCVCVTKNKTKENTKEYTKYTHFKLQWRTAVHCTLLTMSWFIDIWMALNGLSCADVLCS